MNSQSTTMQVGNKRKWRLILKEATFQSMEAMKEAEEKAIKRTKRTSDQMDMDESDEGDEDFSSDDDEEMDESSDSAASDSSIDSEESVDAVPPAVKLSTTLFMDLLDSRHAKRKHRLRMVCVALKEPNFNINQQSSLTGNTFMMILYSVYPSEPTIRNRLRRSLPFSPRFPYERIEKEIDITLKNKRGQNLLHWICARGSRSGRSPVLFKKMLKLCCERKLDLTEPDGKGLKPIHALAKNMKAPARIWSWLISSRINEINLGLLDHTRSTPLHYLFERFCVYDSGWSYKLLNKLCQSPVALSQLSPYDTNDSGTCILHQIQTHAEVRSVRPYHWRRPETADGWTELPHKFETAWLRTILPTMEQELTPYFIPDLLNIIVDYVIGESRKEELINYSSPSTIKSEEEPRWLKEHHDQQRREADERLVATESRWMRKAAREEKRAKKWAKKRRKQRKKAPSERTNSDSSTNSGSSSPSSCSSDSDEFAFPVSDSSSSDETSAPQYWRPKV